MIDFLEKLEKTKQLLKTLWLKETVELRRLNSFPKLDSLKDVHWDKVMIMGLTEWRNNEYGLNWWQVLKFWFGTMWFLINWYDNRSQLMSGIVMWRNWTPKGRNWLDSLYIHKWKLSVKERMCCHRFLLGVERMKALKDLWIGIRWFKVDESIKKMLTSGVDY